MSTKNIVISGTNFWNPGDDFVRDGVIRILYELFPDDQLNFLFYNFNQDFFPQNKFTGIHNMVAKGDLEQYKDFIDFVVIAGLSAGTEIKDLYNWIIDNNLTDRVYLIGAGYENKYVDTHIYEEPELTIFKNAKIITSRTKKAPTIIKELGLPFYHINCPAILSVPEVKDVSENKKIERIAFSIQLPHELGIPNHTCAQAMYLLSIELIGELYNQYEFEVIAHHKSEYFHFLNLFKQYNLNIPVIFSSYYQDLLQLYKRYDTIITTRLHASLFANGFGIPGIILNDTDRHTHCLEGFPHSVWVNSKEKFHVEFNKLKLKKLRTIAEEAKLFKQNLLVQYVEQLKEPFGLVENAYAKKTIAHKQNNDSSSLTIDQSKITQQEESVLEESGNERNIPVHFFTIVLNGMPFIKYHIEVFSRLAFKWHWHIIEGVADLKNDTAWSLAHGGRISDELHANGLSNDGTTDYLDELKNKYPDNITLYRKGNGQFWNGKLEMVNAPFANINEECILWEVDVDELWTAEQLSKGRELYILNPQKTASYYLCNFFVGEKLVITSKNTYGNYTDFEWLRTWKYKPGDKWLTHEPPVLGRKNNDGKWDDLAKIDPFIHAVTQYHQLIFQHFAYVIPEQLKFKEKYYGYKNALNQWSNLQKESQFPTLLKNYFEWVNDDAVVDRVEKLNITPLLSFGKNGGKFNSISLSEAEYNDIIFLRTDSIGDNILSLSMVAKIHERYPFAKITIICQNQIKEVYANIPFVNKIITFNKGTVYSNKGLDSKFEQDLASIKADLLLNPVFSPEPLSFEIAGRIEAKIKVGFRGDSSNITAEEIDKNNLRYNYLIDVPSDQKSEIDKNKFFLNQFGIQTDDLTPLINLAANDKEFARKYFEEKRLDPKKTIVLFPFSQWEIKDYEQFGSLISSPFLDSYNFIILGGIENYQKSEILSSTAPSKVFNLVGETTLLQTAAIIESSRLLIGSDSSGAHLACAVGTPNVVIMGGGHFGRFMPYSKLTTLVTLPLSCYGCNWQCKFDTSHCVKAVDYNLVLEAVETALEQKSEKPRIFLNPSTNKEAFNNLQNMLSNFISLDRVEFVQGNNDRVLSISQQLISLSEKAIADEKLESALELIKNILLIDPSNLDALNNLAVLYILSKQWNEAKNLLAKLIELNPLDEVATENMNYLNTLLVESESVASATYLPKISIITPSYNQGEFLESTIKSVLNQNYPNLEYIIIDGASTDNSVEIIKKFEQHLSYWVSEKDKGQTDAINKGFKRATGEIIAWLNSDDFYFPGALNLIAEMYLSNPDAGLYIGNGAVADRSGKKIRKYSHDIIFDYETLLKGSNYILQPSTFINVKALKEVGYLDETLHYAMDLEYWIRVASKFSVMTINEELSAYRWYDNIKTKNGGLKRWVEQWHIINSYSKLQMTPGLLVEFFNVLQEKEVNDHLGINVSEFSQNVRMQFYQVMQQLLNTNECIPKTGNGEIFSFIDKKNTPPETQQTKTVNIIKSVGSNPKIDIILQATGEHAWGVGRGWENAAKKMGVYNRTFAPKANWGEPELYFDDGLEKYLKSENSDILFLTGFDWHSQVFHKNQHWKELFQNSTAKKILYVQESVINNCRLFKTDEMKKAVWSAAAISDFVVYTDLMDKDFIEGLSIPSLWQPFGVDDSIFFPHIELSKRIHKPFFRGKIKPFYTDDTYDERRRLLKYLSDNKLAELIPYQDKPVTVEEIAADFNKYKMAINLPSIFSNHPTRVYEALACGNALITNRTNNLIVDNLFKDKEHVLYYEDERSLKEAVELLSSNNDLLTNLSKNGNELVREKFTLDKHLSEILNKINESGEVQKSPSGNYELSRQEVSSSPTTRNKIVIDGIIFQLQKNQPLGISRVWASLLTELGKKENDILLLDRGNTAPAIPGIEKISIPLFYDYEVMPSEICYLDEICFEYNAALFISTYYTYTEHTPSLLLLHDFIPELFNWKGLEWNSKKEAIKKAFAYLAVSESTAKDLKKFYPESKSKDVCIVHNAVSDEFFPRSEKEIAAFKKKYKIQQPYFIISGNRNLYKNVIQFAEAFSKLKNKKDYEILFTGGSSELEPDIKKHLGKAKYQIVYLTVDELSTAYSGAVALVYPSKYEGFGLPILEAMKSACPVITCKNSSLIEVAGDAAIFVKEDDIDGLKNALLKVGKPEVREKYIKGGIENAKKFSWTLSGELLAKRINSYLETYNPQFQKPQPNLGSVDNLFYTIKTDELLSKAYDELLLQLKKGLEADEDLLKQKEKIIGSIDAQTYLLPKAVDQSEAPVYPYYYFVLALSYLNRNVYHKSLEAFSLALSHGLNHWIIGSHLADLLIYFNKLDDALIMLEKIISIYPDHKNTLDRISEIKNGETKKLKEFKVSAIISTYNSERFLRGCLDDLINQTLYEKGELEIVVVNSGSTQNEEKIVEEYQSCYSNIKYVKTERETVYQAWNRGIKVASGKYVTNANTDDRHRKDAFEILANELDANDDVGLVYADQFVTRKENQTFDNHEAVGYFEWLDFDRIQLIHCACVGPQPMWRKSLHEKFGYFDEKLKVAGDYDWWLRISEDVGFKHLPEKLGLYLLSNESVEHRYTNEMRDETIKVRMHYGQKAQLQKLDYTKYKSTFLVLSSEKEPVVSVIIPTFNRPEKLKNAIASVLSQNYKNFEVIVINDAGEDVTNVVKQFNDVRVRLINQGINKGLSASRNIGIKEAKGQYIALLDDDDIFYPDHLQILLNNFNEQHKVIYSDAVRNSYVKVGEIFALLTQSVPYSIDYNRNKLLIGNIAPVNCFVFEKSLAIKAGLFDESLPVLEDWDFWLRLSAVTEFKHIKEKTVQVNWYDDGSTMTSSKGKKFEEVRKRINKKYESEIRNIPNPNEIIDEFNAIWKNDFITATPLVSIIALTYNQLEYTKSFVESIIEYTNVPYELILVDNASNNETVEYLNSLCETNKRTKVFFNSTNLGFPKGVNQGINLASGKYVLIANNDIVVTKDWLVRMIEVAESENEIGLVGPISNAVSGVQLDKTAKYDSIAQMHKYAKQNQKKNCQKIIEFPRVAFLCTLIKKEVIEKIGGLDERFSPGNFEDDDFCLRAQTSGYKTVIVQDVFIHHYGSKSFKANGLDDYAKRLEHNKEVFIEKWGADPEEIWLHGKSFKKRNPVFPIDRDIFTANIKRAMIYLEEKDYISAFIYLNQVIENYGEYSANDYEHISLPDLLNLAANAALMFEDYQTANELFEKELNADPTSSRACAGLAEIFLTDEKYHEAKTMLEWAVKNDPTNQSARISLEKVNQELGFPPDNNSHNKQKSVDVQIEELFAETYSLYEKKLFNDSLTVLIELEKFIDARPEDVKPETAASVFNLSGFNYLALSENDLARQSFEKSLNILPDSSTACVGLGEIFYLEGKDKEAKTMYEWAVKNNPTNEMAIKGLSKINEVLGMERNDNSLNASPNIDEQVETLFSETYSLYEKKMYKEALTVLLELEKFVTNSSEEIHPDTLVSIINLSGYNYLGLNDIDNARESFERALNINPSSSSACAGLGEIYATFAMDAEAKTMFEWAVKNNPENQTAVSSLASVNRRLGFSQNHNSLVLKNINPLRIIENKLDLAEELIDQDRNEEAEKLLHEVLAAEPTNVIALNNLSVIEIMNEHYEEAVKLISKVLAINQEDEIALGNMNFIKEKLNSVMEQV